MCVRVCGCVCVRSCMRAVRVCVHACVRECVLIVFVLLWVRVRVRCECRENERVFLLVLSDVCRAFGGSVVPLFFCVFVDFDIDMCYRQPSR